MSRIKLTEKDEQRVAANAAEGFVETYRDEYEVLQFKTVRNDSDYLIFEERGGGWGTDELEFYPANGEAGSIYIACNHEYSVIVPPEAVDRLVEWLIEARKGKG